jgi:hypothetical protein
MHFFIATRNQNWGGGGANPKMKQGKGGKDATHINMVSIRSRLPFVTSLCNSEDHIGDK